MKKAKYDLAGDTEAMLLKKNVNSKFKALRN